jgi:hypothetical protein
VTLVNTDVSEERIASIIRMTRIGELPVTANVVPSSADSFHFYDGGDTFLRNVGSHKIHTVSHSRDRYSSF